MDVLGGRGRGHVFAPHDKDTVGGRVPSVAMMVEGIEMPLCGWLWLAMGGKGEN